MVRIECKRLFDMYTLTRFLSQTTQQSHGGFPTTDSTIICVQYKSVKVVRSTNVKKTSEIETIQSRESTGNLIRVKADAPSQPKLVNISFIIEASTRINEEMTGRRLESYLTKTPFQ